MKAVKKIEISVLHKRITPIVYAVQGDTGREIECTVVDWDIPAGVTARVWVVKPSKKVVYNDCRIVDKAVFVPMTNQTLAEPGGAICMIEFVSGEDVVSSFSFNLYVYESASGDGIESNNESTVLEKMFEELAQDAIKTLNEAKAQAAAAKKSAQDTEKIKNDFTLTAQQSVADVNNAGQTQTQRVNTAGDTQVSRIQAEGTTQVQNVQATAAEISEDREQIHTNRDNTARLQRTTAGAIMRSAEGSFITLEDAADEMGYKRIEIPGMTEQRTTTGAQLFDASKLPTATANGATVTNNGDGSFTISGTPTASGGISYYAYSHDESVKLFPAGTYTLKCEKATRPYFYLTFSYTGGRVELNNNNTTILTKDITEDMVNTANYQVTFGFYVNIETTLQIGTIRPMLYCDGDGTWEPYTGSKPSPSPEYPQELENVGKQNTDGKYAVKVTATKTQLLDTRINFWAQGAINTGGAESENAARIRTTGKTHVDPKQIYTLNISDGYYIAYHQYDKNEEYISDSSWITSYPHIMVLNKNTNYVKFTVYKAGNEAITPAVINNGLKIMLNVGSAPLPWEPYRGHTATITSDRPLTKWDKLTCRDGVWGWEYKGGTKIYDGSADEAWYMYSDGTSFALQDNTFALGFQRSMCDKFINVDRAWSTTYDGCYIIYSDHDSLDRKYFRPPNADVTTAEQWRTWLAGHPITLQYQTVAEEWVPLTGTEQTAMNALCTYAGTTHIWTDDPLQPVISLDYTVDTEGYIRDSAPAYRDVEKFALTGEVSGTVATCADSAEWPLLGIGMLGKCEQLTTTGKNLFGGRALADKIMEVAPDSIIDEDKGTITFASNIISGKTLYDNFEAGKRYTIILCGKNTDQSYTATNLRLTYDDGINVSLSFQTANAYSYCVYSSTVGKTVVSMSGIWITSKTELQYDKCGIFEGAIDIASFEPYTGTAPSPSPTYKQEIQKTGTYNPETGMYEADMVMTGAQLFDQTTVTKQSYVNDVTGKIGSTAEDVNASDYISVMGYEYIKITSTMKTKQWGAFYDNNKTFLSGIVGYDKPIPVPPDASYARLTVIGDNLKTFMVNAGAIALPWEPYQSDTLRLTADQPWRGIGDVHDEVCERDGVLGTWRRYATTVYNTAAPSEDDILAQTKGIRIKAPKDALYNGEILCDKFTREATWGNDKPYIFNYGGGAAREIAFRVAVGENKDTFFVDNPIKLIYQLATPVWEPFPEDVQRAYRKLKSYAGTTHAWVDDPLQPEVSFRYIKDSKLVLGKLEDRLTALEAGLAQTAAAFGYLPANIQAEMIENETNQLMDSI